MRQAALYAKPGEDSSIARWGCAGVTVRGIRSYSDSGTTADPIESGGDAERRVGNDDRAASLFAAIISFLRHLPEQFTGRAFERAQDATAARQGAEQAG